MPETSSSTLLTTALSAADRAAEVQRRWVGRVGMEEVDVKGFGDFVSRVDREAQEAALSAIRDRHPGHEILAEEGATDLEIALGGRTPTWVVDPLDGTKNFLHGHPFFAASVAVAIEGEVVAGAVVAPITGERWWAVRGGGAWKNGRAIGVAPPRRLVQAMVGTGFPFKALSLVPRYTAGFAEMIRAGAALRRAGAAAIDLCYLAEGRFDAFWELQLHPWDFAAGSLIITEAGGTVATVEGGLLRLRSGSVVGASHPALLAEMLEVVRRPEQGE